jgi:hypothetical protein
MPNNSSATLPTNGKVKVRKAGWKRVDIYDLIN